MSVRHWLTVGLTGVALVACGGREPNPAQIAALPTADVVVPLASGAQVVPLTPTITPAISVASRVLDGAPTASTLAATQEPVLPSPSPVAAIPTPEADLAAPLEAMLIVEINKVRVANNLPAYRASPELSAAARAHSCDLASHHIISHVSSDGRKLTDRLAASDPPWQWPSESIAAGTADPATVVAWWMDEPPDGWHRRNILDEQQREVGAGYCIVEDDPTGNHSYWTADFSRREP